MTAPVDITLTVNSSQYRVRVEPRKTLADTLREDCRLTGTHLGCEHGVCGACTVLIDDEPVRSCLMFTVQCGGVSIRTIESVADSDRLHPLQEQFCEHHALQCGFCTPGFIMLTLSLLESDPSPDDDEIKEVLSSNLCRCTGYEKIIKAVRATSEIMRDAQRPDQE